MSFLGALGGAFGGAAQGVSGAMPDIMQMQQRQREAAGLQSYRDQSIAVDEERNKQNALQGRWTRYYDAMGERRRMMEAETDRIRVEHAINTANSTREAAATEELYSARYQRALSVLSQANDPSMSPRERDELAQRMRFPDYGAVEAVIDNMRGDLNDYVPLMPRQPEESGYERMMRLRRATGGMQPSGISQWYNGPQGGAPMGGAQGGAAAELNRYLDEDY